MKNNLWLVIFIPFFVGITMIAASVAEILIGKNDEIITLFIGIIPLVIGFVMIYMVAKYKQVLAKGRTSKGTYIKHLPNVKLNNRIFYTIKYSFIDEFGEERDANPIFQYYSKEDALKFKQLGEFEIKVLGKKSYITEDISRMENFNTKKDEKVLETNHTEQDIDYKPDIDFHQEEDFHQEDQEIICEYCLKSFDSTKKRCPYCNAKKRK